MLQQIQTLPAHVAGVHATGEVTQYDMETVLIPLLDSLVERKDKINYILVLETPVQNFTLGAWWDDLKLGLKNFTHWNRIAIVSDQKAVEYFSDVFRFFVPGKSKGFSLDELQEAYNWISETD